MEAICCHGNISSDPIRPKHNAFFPPIPMMFKMISGCDQPAALYDIHDLKCLGMGVRTDGRAGAGSSPIL